ncbi:hypothetical protein MHYP_G00238290 [Metynnis hypsauchen]
MGIERERERECVALPAVGPISAPVPASSRPCVSRLTLFWTQPKFAPLSLPSNGCSRWGGGGVPETGTIPEDGRGKRSIMGLNGRGVLEYRTGAVLPGCFKHGDQSSDRFGREEGWATLLSTPLFNMGLYGPPDKRPAHA